MSMESDSRYSHRIFKNDPILFKSYINKNVIIKTKDSQVHQGVLYVVDPVSESAVLIVPECNGTFNAKIIMGDSIEGIEMTTQNSVEPLPELFPSTQHELSETELTEKKESVIKMMTENRFPVKDINGILHIQDMVSIEPPYELENCICSNPIIMSRIQSILRQVNKSS